MTNNRSVRTELVVVATLVGVTLVLGWASGPVLGRYLNVIPATIVVALVGLAVVLVRRRRAT